MYAPQLVEMRTLPQYFIKHDFKLNFLQLSSNDETLSFLLDEGSFVVVDVIPGVSDPGRRTELDKLS